MLGLIAAISHPGRGQCGLQWSDRFARPTVAPHAMVVHDDGSGVAVYFAAIDGGVVRWRTPGAPLEPVGGSFEPASPVVPKVRDLAVFDDGQGAALYATGAFTGVSGVACNGIARWNGSAWTPLGSGLDGPGRTLAVYDDGSGPALCVGGDFTHAGGVGCRVARWNGVAWSAAATMLSGTLQQPFEGPFVAELEVYDPGTGSRLYAAGLFDGVDGVTASNIASFDGSAWTPLGSGVVPTSPNAEAVLDLHVHDDGNGAQLYACGAFSSVASSKISRWNGLAWGAVGAGVVGTPVTMTTWHCPTGTVLAVGNNFTLSFAPAQWTLQFWDGSAWSNGGTSGRVADVLRAFDLGDGEKLYAVGGAIINLSPTGYGGFTNGFLEFDGVQWRSLAGEGMYAEHVKSLVVHDDGTGAQLYASGPIAGAGGNGYRRVTRWNGTAWSAVGAGLDDPSPLVSIASGPAAGLYALSFGVRRWNGTTWNQVGPSFNAVVNSATSFDFGAGAVLVAGGPFTANAGGPALHGVAFWNGSSWAPLGAPGFGGAQGPGVVVLKVLDDGSGPALYAAGSFTSAGGFPAGGIAKWTGSSWMPLGGGVSGSLGIVLALEKFDDGSGPEIYAAGDFTAAGGVAAANVARWNGSSWAPLGPGTSGPPSAAGTIFALKRFDDGSGPRLYASGFFTNAGGVPASRIAAWDGSGWSAIGSGLELLPVNSTGNAVGLTMEAFDPTGAGASLFVGGYFTHAGGNESVRIAEIVPSRPRLALSQPGGPGTGVLVASSHLAPGTEYFNIFSVEPAPLGPGTGPYLGLYATDSTPLYAQFALPLGAVPFHFAASSVAMSFGPYPAPAGLVIEGVCFEFSGGTIGCASTNPHLAVQ